MKIKPTKKKSLSKFSFLKIKMLFLMGVVVCLGGMLGGVGMAMAAGAIPEMDLIESYSSTGGTPQFKDNDQDLIYKIEQGNNLIFSVTTSQSDLNYLWEVKKGSEVLISSTEGAAFNWTVPSEKSTWEISLEVNLKNAVGETIGRDYLSWSITTSDLITVQPDESIQNAIDSISSDGGIVELAPGTWTISSTITISKSNMTLQGAGAASTKLQWSAGPFITSNGHNDILLQDMWLDGANAAQPDLEGVYFQNGERITIKNIKLTGYSKHGIRGASITNMNIYNSTIIGGSNSNSGIFFGFVSNGEIIGNTITNGAAFGVEINQQNGGILVADNVVSGFAIAGQYMYSKGYGNIITNNTYYGNRDGIRFLSGEGWTVEGNTIRDNTENGIIMIEHFYMGSATFSENLIYGNGDAGIYSFQNAPATKWTPTIVIKNNVIDSNTEQGIVLSMVEVTFDVSNNIISNNGWVGMSRSAGTFNSEYNNLYGNDGTYSGTISNSNDIYSDPLFYNASIHDYHLKSMLGRWNGYIWITDAVTSLCIDTGDPTDDYSNEPALNGERINMGAYGNTIYASKSVVTPTVSTPTFSPTQGTYSGAQTVTISTATSDAVMYYTIDESAPTESSPTYSSPITISSTTILKAKAYKSGSNPSEIATATYTITAPSDTTPPICSSGSPTGTLSSGTTSATLSLSTNETATCKYSTIADTVYSSIANTFTSTNPTSHSTTITGLTDGSNYTYYIRCIDASDNANTSDYTISFFVASSGGGGGGGGGGGTPADTTSPSEITDFTASAGDGEIVLTWKNPTDSDFVRTKILRKEDDYPVNTGDGELVYDGNEETYTDTGLTNNTAYYYSAFTYDEVPNYSESAAASATPEEGKVPNPSPSDPDPEEEIYPERTLLQTPDSFKIYAIINQKKKWIPTPEVFETLGYEWTNITQITTITLNAIPNYEDNLIRAINDYKVYLVVNGIKRHIPNPEIFLNYGFAWDDVVDVPQTTIDKYTRGHLVRESKQEAIYYLRADGVRKWIRNSEIFTSYSNSWDDVQVISKMEIDSYPESNLIQLSGDNRIYLIENNAKRYISSASVFNRYGYNWEHIVTVNKVEFDFYGMGGELR